MTHFQAGGGWRRPKAPIGRRWPSCRSIPRSRTTSASPSRPRAGTGRPSAVSRRRSSAIPASSRHTITGRRADAARRDAEAIKAFGRAAQLEPQHYAGASRIGFPLWLAQGERGRALDHLARTYELRRGDDRTAIARKSLTTATRHKLEHDAEQFLYLSQRTRDRLRFELLARNYRAIAEQLADEVTPAFRCADRGAGRRLQHADPSARSARGRGPRRQ